MNMKRITSILALLLVLITVFAIPVSASSAYQTYTYSIDGTPLYSPDAYSPYQTLTSADMGLDVDLKNPADLVTDDEQNVYIADAGNNRIIILNRYYRDPKYISTFTNAHGIDDGLSDPRGVFVTKDAIWVCDTGNARIVVFDRKGNFVREIAEPKSALFDANSVYKPVAMAVDDFGRLYVVSSTTFQGIIVLTNDGEFVKFIGAQAVTISAWEIIWRKFQTDEQRKLSSNYVSTEFNNITYTSGEEQGSGYIYVTTSSIDPATAEAQIRGNVKTGDFAPVKMLNSAGDEIMRRNGFWPPSGEIDILGGFNKDTNVNGPSRIIDVACGPEKTWSIIDEKRSKIYTYDFNGNLLFAFGDKGTMLGAVANIEAITYQGDTMLILDKAKDSCVIVYERTEYGDLLLEAIAAENSLDYTYAIQCWRAVLQHNSNFDAAYVGIGNALYRSGEYEAAMEYYETAYDTANWSNSYREVRKEWMSDYFLLLMLIIIVVIVAVLKFFGYAKKVNKKAATDGRERKTFWQELMFGFHTIFHPFDGFWDLKHEKRGSLRAALVFVALTVLAFFYQSIGQGYVLNPQGAYSTIWAQALSVLVPMLLFVIANWCLTTLFDGEGSFKDVFVAVSYCLLPVPMLVIPATFLSNFVTAEEAGLISLVTTLAFVWMGIMVFFATMVTHDYSMGRNILTFLGTIVGMALIMFVAVLFTTLVSKIVSLITNIVTELQYRA